MLQLKEYQERSLAALEDYCRTAAQTGPREAFIHLTERPYRSVPQLPELPYVCLRVPTGGGKTLMACHALGIATSEFVQAERAVCLWIVPSNAILEQTLSALRDRAHPYRHALESCFAGPVSVMDIAEALYVQRSTLTGETAVIVSTFAALRVENTEGRKVYESAGALQHHFSGLAPSLIDTLEKNDNGVIPYSLANVLRLHRPVIIMDEAHNARTHLSFETLARLQPSCIIEFTATPETRHKPDKGIFASNVLHHCSAAELKAENMVKLPVKLRTRPAWKEVLADAVQAQKDLEKRALQEEQVTGEYLRPIVLHQAQPNYKERENLTVDVVKKSLMDDFNVPEEHIAIATAQVRELDDLDSLLARDCPIRHIITVQALKEGWDCPFAYVLCSVAETSSKRAVEQILGRVLRMPHATRRRTEELNCAYAFCASSKFLDAATSLRDALVENGFQRIEAEELVVGASTQSQGSTTTYPLFDRFPCTEKVGEKPDFSTLSGGLRDQMSYNESTGELMTNNVISEEEEEYVRQCFRTAPAQEAVTRLARRSRQAAGDSSTPKKRPRIKVRLLGVRIGDQLALFDESQFLEYEWHLNEADATLSEDEFPSEGYSGQSGEIDVTDTGKIEMRFVENLHQQMLSLSEEWGWSQARLVNWLDRQIPHTDLTQTQATLFINRVVDYLVKERGIGLEQLARRKFRLRDAVASKIDQHRRAQWKQAYNKTLFGPDAAALETSPELCIEMCEENYSPNWYYEGSYKFGNHAFSKVGELKPDGEEFECAQFLDTLEEVECWVRNIERRRDTSFWLQTSTDRFYPDFVARLKDGRILVVECKGEHLWSNDDSKEKRSIGDLWADRGNGECVFVMPNGPDWGAISAAIRK